MKGTLRNVEILKHNFRSSKNGKEATQFGHRFKLYITTLLFASLFFAKVSGQTNNWTAGTNANANWNTAGNWSAGIPSTTSDITFPTGVTVTFTTVPTTTVRSIIINGTGSVRFNAGNTLTVSNGGTVAGTLLANGSTVVTFSGGILINNGTVTGGTSASSNLNFGSGSTYQHNINGGTIPFANWNTASNCNITGVTGTIPTVANFAQTFGNFTWNCGSQTLQASTVGNLTSVAGILDIINTGTGDLRIANGGVTTTCNYTTIQMDGGTFSLNGNTGVNTISVNITTINLNAGTLTLLSSGSGGSSPAALNVSGNWTNNGGSFTPSNGTVTFSGASAQIGGTSSTTFAAIALTSGASVTLNTSGSCATLTLPTTPTTATAFSISPGITLTVSGAVTLPLPGTGGTNTVAVGAGTLSAASIALGGTTSTTLKTAITISTGTATVSGNITSAGVGSQIVFSGSGILNAGGTFLSGTAGTFTASTGTVNFNAAGAQAISPSPYTFNNVTLSGSGAKTTTNAAINGILSMQGTATTTGTIATYGTTASLEYKGTAAQTTGIEFPASWTGTGGVIINNSNGVSLNASSSIGALSKLTLTSGFITTTTNLLSVLNTSNLAVIYTAGYVNGPLKWSLPTISSATSYAFPVGAGGSLLPFTLTPSSATTPVITVQAFASAPSSPDNTTITALSSTEYWSAAIISGTYTQGTISLTRQTPVGTTLNAIAVSTAATTSTYSSLGGTPSGSSINTSNPTGNTLGYFAMATLVKPAPTNQPTSFAAGTLTTSNVPLTWIAALSGTQAPDGYLIKGSTGAITAPTNGIDPGNPTSISGGTANVKVTPQSASSYSSFTGFAAGTMYNFNIYSYTNSGTAIAYNLTSSPTINAATLPNPVIVSSITITGTTTATINWSAATGYLSATNSTLVFIKATSAVTQGTPSNAPSAYTANTVFGSGTTYQNDAVAYCVYNNDGTSVSVTGLNPNTTYSVLIYAVVDQSNSAGGNSYSSATVPTAQTTNKAEPTNQPTLFAKGTLTTTNVPLTWTAAATGTQAPDGYYIQASNASTPSDPVDGTSVGNQLSLTGGTANAQVTPQSAASYSSFTNFSAGTMYYFKINSYTNSGTSINYKTTSPAGPTLNAATLPNVVGSAAFTASGIGGTTAGISWTTAGINSTTQSILVFVKAGVTAITTGTATSAPSVYTASTNFSSPGTAYQLDAAAYCVYNGTGTSVSITGLNPNTTYQVLILTVMNASNSDGSNSSSAYVTTSGLTNKLNRPTSQHYLPRER